MVTQLEKSAKKIFKMTCGGPGSGRHKAENAKTSNEHKSAAQYHIHKSNEFKMKGKSSLAEAHYNAAIKHHIASKPSSTSRESNTANQYSKEAHSLES